MFSSYAKSLGGANRSSLMLVPFLQGAGLPFAEVLSAEQIDDALQAEGACFGQCARAVYTPFAGKHTGETSLLRSLFDLLQPGGLDIPKPRVLSPSSFARRDFLRTVAGAVAALAALPRAT